MNWLSFLNIIKNSYFIQKRQDIIIGFLRLILLILYMIWLLIWPRTSLSLAEVCFIFILSCILHTDPVIWSALRVFIGLLVQGIVPVDLFMNYDLVQPLKLYIIMLLNNLKVLQEMVPKLLLSSPFLMVLNLARSYRSKIYGRCNFFYVMLI